MRISENNECSCYNSMHSLLIFLLYWNLEAILFNFKIVYDHKKIITKCLSYKAFHGIGQAKFDYGNSVLGSSKFTLATAPVASQNDAQF